MLNMQSFQMANQCKTCGKNCNDEYCFHHKPRKPLSKGRGLSKVKDKVSKSELKSAQINDMRKFFMQYWKENKEHTCEVCRVWLGSDPLSYMFDHVLEKSKYPHLAFEPENIMYLCLTCHDNKTRWNLSPIMLERINYLKTKYNLQ